MPTRRIQEDRQKTALRMVAWCRGVACRKTWNDMSQDARYVKRIVDRLEKQFPSCQRQTFGNESVLTGPISKSKETY